MLDDPRDAEEITQDVILTVVRKIQTFKGEAALSSWVYRIAANAAYGRLRAQRSRPEVSLEPFLPVFDEEGRHAQRVADWSPQLDDPVLASEARAAIERSLRRLPEEYRAVLLLRDVEGLSSEDTATALRLTVAAVKSRLHRARLVLRQQLAHLLTPGR
jgi:RNA polymerase sigma-70 factor (ECF subfamily)